MIPFVWRAYSTYASYKIKFGWCFIFGVMKMFHTMISNGCVSVYTPEIIDLNFKNEFYSI